MKNPTNIIHAKLTIFDAVTATIMGLLVHFTIVVTLNQSNCNILSAKLDISIK